MTTRTITILQHLQQNCYCACGHFWTSGTEELIFVYEIKYLSLNAINLYFRSFRNILLRNPVGNYLFKVSKITVEQRPSGRCSNVILLTLNRYLQLGKDVVIKKNEKYFILLNQPNLVPRTSSLLYAKGEKFLWREEVLDESTWPSTSFPGLH